VAVVSLGAVFILGCCAVIVAAVLYLVGGNGTGRWF